MIADALRIGMIGGMNVYQYEDFFLDGWNIVMDAILNDVSDTRRTDNVWRYARNATGAIVRNATANINAERVVVGDNYYNATGQWSQFVNSNIVAWNSLPWTMFCAAKSNDTSLANNAIWSAGNACKLSINSKMSCYGVSADVAIGDTLQHTLAASCDGVTAKLYIDGHLVKTGNATISDEVYGLYASADHNIYSICKYNRVLTDAEVKHLHDAAFYRFAFGVPASAGGGGINV